jgi:hypothetical protein
MANALYDNGRQSFLQADIDFLVANIKIALIDEADDTIDLVNDDFWNDRAAAAREEISGNLASKTATAGVADAADVVFTAAAGDPCESIDMYEDTGTETTSHMICNIDTATGLPVTLGGGDVTVVWDSGANRIFKL